MPISPPSPLSRQPLGRTKWLFVAMAAMFAWTLVVYPAKGVSLVVPVRRGTDVALLDVEITLTKFSFGSDGCCEETFKRTARLDIGVSRAEVSFQDLQPCAGSNDNCSYQLSWSGQATRFGNMPIKLADETQVRLSDIELKEGRVLSGRIHVEDGKPYQQAFVTLINADLPKGTVQLPVTSDGTFSFVGAPAGGSVKWEFSSLRQDLMKVQGDWDGEAQLVIEVRAAQEIRGCLRQSGIPVAGASVQLFYASWPGGPIEVGSDGPGRDGCFRLLRDREAPAELRIYFGPTGRLWVRLPDIEAGRSTPLDLGVIVLSER